MRRNLVIGASMPVQGLTTASNKAPRVRDGIAENYVMQQLVAAGRR